MNNYEVLYVLETEQTDEAISEQIDKFTEVITSNGGEVSETDKWGKKRLAYPIDYKNEGYYILTTFKAAPEFPQELERNFRIDEMVMRYMVIRLEDD